MIFNINVKWRLLKQNKRQIISTKLANEMGGKSRTFSGKIFCNRLSVAFYTQYYTSLVYELLGQSCNFLWSRTSNTVFGNLYCISIRGLHFAKCKLFPKFHKLFRRAFPTLTSIPTDPPDLLCLYIFANRLRIFNF